jgi:glycosyltransferase involved in cell wall biosynthesis
MQVQTEPTNCPAADRAPVRVAFVLHSLGVAGAEVLVVETIRRLAGRIAPSVYCLDTVGALGERLRADGVDVQCLGRRPGRDFGVAWRLARALRRCPPDVLHAHQYTPFFYAALDRVLAGGAPRLVFTEHGRHYPDVVSPLRRLGNRLVLARRAHAVNAVCEFSAHQLRDVDGFSGRRIEVIANGIDLAHYAKAADRAALRRQLGLEPARRYLVNVARCHPVKDQAMLLRAFGDVAAARPDVDLLIAGDGALRGKLETLAGTLGIAARVRFLGVRADVPALLQASDIFVLTSRSEAASLTLLEAMAAGLPVVVTAVGGNPEIVRHGIEGLLVPRGDAAATAGAILSLLDEPARAAALGTAGAARARQHYRLEQTLEEYYTLYRRLAGRA